MTSTVTSADGTRIAYDRRAPAPPSSSSRPS